MSQPKRRFGGLIVVQPPEHLSYDPALLRTPEVLTREQQLELTRTQAWQLVQKLVGKPMRTEHSRVKVGEVVNAYIDDQGNACVRFELDDTEEGRRQARMIDAGYTRELSLAHYLGTDEALEVSICFEGAREGTVITEGLEQNNPSEYKPPPDAVTPATTQSVLIQASASMDHQTALPPASAVAPPQPLSLSVTAPAIELLHPSQLGQPPPGQAAANPHKITSITGGPPKRRRVVTNADGSTMEVEEPENAAAEAPKPQGTSPFAAAGPPPISIQATGQPLQQQQQPFAPQQQQQQQQFAPPPQQQFAPPPQQQLAPQQQQMTAPPQQQQQKPTEPPKLTYEQQKQLLETMARKHGQLSVEEQEQIILTLDQYRKEAEQLKHALNQSKQTLQQQPGNQQARSDMDTQRMRLEHMVSMMGPFLRTFSGEEMSDKELNNLLDHLRARPEEADKYLLKASANAVVMAERLRSQSAVDPRVQRALGVFQEAVTTGTFPSQQYGWGPNPEMQSYLQPQQQQQPMYAPQQQPMYAPQQQQPMYAPQQQQPMYAPQQQQPMYAPPQQQHQPYLVNASQQQQQQPMYAPQPQQQQQPMYAPPPQPQQLPAFTLYGPRPPLPVFASAGGGGGGASVFSTPPEPMSLYAPTSAPAAAGTPDRDPLAVLVQASMTARRYPTAEEAKEAHLRYLTRMANQMPTPSDLVDRDRAAMIKRAEALPGPDEMRQSSRQFALPANVFQN